MLKKLLTYICMFLVAGIGFFGISNGSFHSANSLVLGTQVFAGMCDDDPAQC